MCNPKVSIVIPIYNAERHLDKCLASIASQTEEDYEVLMIDDGSTDGSAAIARRYENDSRFTYFYQENRGVSTARNRGLEMSSGSWVAFVDADDSVEEEYLQILLSETNSSVDIVSCCAKYQGKDGVWNQIHFYDCDYCFVDDIKGIKNSDTIFFSAKLNEKKQLYLELINSQWGASEPRKTAIGVPWGKLYRRTFLQENNLVFHTKLKRLQDNIFNMFAFEKARVIRYIDKPLYHYNIEHITGFGKRYEPRAPEFYDLVLQIRHNFLVKSGLIQDQEIHHEYCREVKTTTHTMLQSFYLHTENPMSDNDRICAMKIKFSDLMYRDAFREHKAKVTGKGRNIRLFLLEHELYRVLFVADRAICAFKRITASDPSIPKEMTRGGALTR